MGTVQPETVGFSSERLGRIRPVMQRYIDEGKIAGIVSMAARCGKLAHFESFGKMDLASGKPMSLDAIFRIYSMTKPITSTAAMMLFEQGYFRLNDPVSRYIPELKGLKVIDTTSGGATTVGATAGSATANGVALEEMRREITIRDLFTHTAGFSYGFDEHDYLDGLYREQIWQKVGEQPGFTLKDFVGQLSRLPLAHQPGTTFHYSVAIDVLGYLVEVLSGMPFDTFLQQHIFEPLGMHDTSFWVPPEKADRLAAMYGPDDKHPGQLIDIDPHAKSSYTRPVSLLSGGGGLVSTAADYLRFSQMLLNRGELDGVRLLGRKTVEMMTLNHLPDGVFVDENRAFGFGLGGQVELNVARAQTLGSVGNWGWGGAANTIFWIDFKEQLIGILMLQFQPVNTYPIEEDFQNLVYQALVD